MFGSPNNLGHPASGYDPHAILDTEDEQKRLALMRQMGVANVDPPLPHSPYLKNIKTGRILPWNELIAQHRDLFVCCDKDGNTDEAVWGPQVITNTVSNAELEVMARQQVFTRNFTAHDGYTHHIPQSHLNDNSQSEYEKLGVISYADIQQLRDMLHGSKSDNS